VVDAGSQDGKSLARIMTEKLALVAFRVVGSTDRRSHATVRISRGGRDHAQAEAEGNDPMDALFRATNAAVGVEGEVTGLRRGTRLRARGRRLPVQ
jgi:hypothetical protein